MSGMYVRDRYLFNRSREGKWTGLEYAVPGKVHVVAPTTAYDSDFSIGSAGSWARNVHPYVFDSVKLAHDACQDGRGDAILCMSGTHTVSTASLALNKTGVKIFGPEAWMGLDAQAPSAILTTSIAGDEIANITAPDVALIGLTIRPITQAKGIDFSAVANGLLVDKCHFDLYTPAAHTSTIGIAATGAASYVSIRGSRFFSDGAQGPAITATALLDSVIRDCLFQNNAGTWAAAVLCGAATKGLEIAWNRFMCYGTAMTVGVDGTGASLASGVWIHDNRAGSLVTKLVDNFDAGEAEISENYDSGVGATDGGTLVIAIT